MNVTVYIWKLAYFRWLYRCGTVLTILYDCNGIHMTVTVLTILYDWVCEFEICFVISRLIMWFQDWLCDFKIDYVILKFSLWFWILFCDFEMVLWFWYFLVCFQNPHMSTRNLKVSRSCDFPKVDVWFEHGPWRYYHRVKTSWVFPHFSTVILKRSKKKRSQFLENFQFFRFFTFKMTKFHF